MKLARLLFAMLCLSSASAHALDVSGLTVTGEAAFDYNMLSSEDNKIPNSDDVLHEVYRLRNAQVLINKDAEKFAFTTRLWYKPTSYRAESGSPATESNTTSIFNTLDQIELYYKPMSNLYIGFGRFLTTMGFESTMKAENAFYMNTIAYSQIVPGYGEGLRAKYVMNEMLTATLSTYNTALYSGYSDNYHPTKTTELSLTGKLGALTWFAGHYMGTDSPVGQTKFDRNTTGVWASYQITDSFLFTLTFDSITNKPVGGTNQTTSATTALATYTIGKNNLSARYEMVRGANYIGYGTSDRVDSMSFSEKYKLSENMNVYAEYRADKTNEKTLTDKKGAATDNVSIITLGALAYF